MTPDAKVEQPQVTKQEEKEVKAEVSSQVSDNTPVQEEGFELVFYNEKPASQVKEEVPVSLPQPNFNYSPVDEAEAQKAKAAERLYKLRNLSFNFNASDPNNEYEHVPAYVRQNLQMQSTSLASVEKFYSSYSVGTDEDNSIQISTINTFLEGKKPD